ncbi:MAG: hotdog fold thioesterase [Ktedonobacteraceae bacterium]
MSEQQVSRTRTITWQDPAPGLERSKSMSGLEYLKSIHAGELPPPPVAALMGFEISEVSEGRVVFTAQAAEYLYNPLGTVHGGVTATLIDSAMGCAVQSTLPVGAGYTTLEIKVNYIRAITTKTGMLHCEGKVIYAGGRVATAEARVIDDDGKLYAHGTTTCILFR